MVDAWLVKRSRASLFLLVVISMPARALLLIFQPPKYCTSLWISGWLSFLNLATDGTLENANCEWPQLPSAHERCIAQDVFKGKPQQSVHSDACFHLCHSAHVPVQKGTYISPYCLRLPNCSRWDWLIAVKLLAIEMRCVF